MARAALLLTFLLVACRHAGAPAPGTAAPSSAATTHAGAPGAACTGLAGTWHHAESPSYAFRVEERGDEVLMHPFTPGEPDAPEAPKIVIVLRRGPGGLAGVTRQTAPQRFEDGETRTCTVEFATRIVSCEPGRLVVEVEQSGAVDKQCRRAPEDPPDVARHELVRD